MEVVKNLDRRRLLFYLLLITVAGIWILVFYSVSQQFERNEQIVNESSDAMEMLTRTIEKPQDSQPFFSSVEHPFKLPELLFESSDIPVNLVTPKAKSKEKSVRLPALILRGITGSTATFHDGKDSVYFVNRGDVIEGMRILQLAHDRVYAQYENQTFTLLIKP